MHKTIQESCAFVKLLVALVGKIPPFAVGLAVSSTALSSVAHQLQAEQMDLWLGGQNISEHPSGAYTGEVSAQMVRDAGASFVLVGHSERRHLFFESSQVVNQKIYQALQQELTPVVCVGETETQRRLGQTEQVLEEQVKQSLNGLSVDQIGLLQMAYEPVWAIGTGQVSHPQDAAQAHAIIRKVIADQWGEQQGKDMIIQYGGSVKPDHVRGLLEQEEIDGLLVGGASLDPYSFEQIIKKAQL